MHDILLREFNVGILPSYNETPIQFSVVDEFVNYSDEGSIQFDFLDNSEEFNSDSFFPKKQYAFSLDVSSLDYIGQYLKNGIVEVFSYLIKDKILLATILSCTALLVFFMLMPLPPSANIAASLFTLAPLSTAFMGYYKKQKSKFSYGI